MTAKATIIDYGSGNIFSILHALENSGSKIELTDDPKRLVAAERLVLPGVGAFGNAMGQLRDYNFIEPILRFIETGRPFLGICVGMQMMLDHSEEFGCHDGLGLIPGRVLAIPPTDTNGVSQPVPHIGWNKLSRTEQSWQSTILEHMEAESAVYFVHSFCAVPDKKSQILATCDYGNRSIVAAISKDNMFGTQFHPEADSASALDAKIFEEFVVGITGEVPAMRLVA